MTHEFNEPSLMVPKYVPPGLPSVESTPDGTPLFLAREGELGSEIKVGLQASSELAKFVIPTRERGFDGHEETHVSVVGGSQIEVTGSGSINGSRTARTPVGGVSRSTSVAYFKDVPKTS